MEQKYPNQIKVNPFFADIAAVVATGAIGDFPTASDEKINVITVNFGEAIFKKETPEKIGYIFTVEREVGIRAIYNKKTGVYTAESEDRSYDPDHAKAIFKKLEGLYNTHRSVRPS
jgi:hypothetical protein